MHQHLSTAGEPLTPGELWYGQKLNVPSLVSLWSVVKEDTDLQVYAKRLRERLRLVQSYVAASEEKYFAQMGKVSKERCKALRTFKVGDLVTRYRPTTSERVNKLAYLQDGPFIVLQAQPSGTSYVIKRQNSDEKQVLVHVDEINAFRPPGVYKRTRSCKQQAGGAVVPSAATKANKSTKAKSTVEQVLAEEDHAAYGKRYLIRWSGVDASGNGWKCLWEKQEDMECDERVSDFMMASGAERATRWEAALALGVVDMLTAEAEDSSEGEASDAAGAVTECYACTECCRECAVGVAAVKDSVNVTAIQFDISSDWEGSITTPLYSHLSNESVRKNVFYGLAIALTKS